MVCTYKAITLCIITIYNSYYLCLFVFSYNITILQISQLVCCLVHKTIFPLTPFKTRHRSFSQLQLIFLTAMYRGPQLFFCFLQKQLAVLAEVLLLDWENKLEIPYLRKYNCEVALTCKKPYWIYWTFEIPSYLLKYTMIERI